MKCLSGMGCVLYGLIFAWAAFEEFNFPKGVAETPKWLYICTVIVARV